MIYIPKSRVASETAFCILKFLIAKDLDFKLLKETKLRYNLVVNFDGKNYDCEVYTSPKNVNVKIDGEILRYKKDSFATIVNNFLKGEKDIILYGGFLNNHIEDNIKKKDSDKIKNTQAVFDDNFINEDLIRFGGVIKDFTFKYIDLEDKVVEIKEIKLDLPPLSYDGIYSPTKCTKIDFK